ncbi:MAG: Flp family type IVb pilin [Chloroflexaceae bacterium]
MRWLSMLLCALSEMIQRKLWRLRACILARSPAQGLTEYGLILVLIMVVCVVIIGTTGQTISEVWYDKIVPAFP